MNGHGSHRGLVTTGMTGPGLVRFVFRKAHSWFPADGAGGVLIYENQTCGDGAGTGVGESRFEWDRPNSRAGKAGSTGPAGAAGTTASTGPACATSAVATAATVGAGSTRAARSTGPSGSTRTARSTGPSGPAGTARDTGHQSSVHLYEFPPGARKIVAS